MKRDHENTKASGSPKGGMNMGEYERHLRGHGGKAHHMGDNMRGTMKGSKGHNERRERKMGYE